MMRLTRLYPMLAFVLIGFAAGCTFSTELPEATPTLIPVTLTASATYSPTPSATATPTEAALATTAPALVQPSETPLPPSETPTPTNTPGPYLHELQSGETLGFIIQQYGHRSFDVIQEVVRINDNIFNADALPPPGSIILIPRPTPTPLPESASGGGEVADNTAPQQAPSNISNGLTLVHVVQEGESLVDISQQYSTTLEIISQLNPDIGFFGCNFNIPSGGPDCIIILQVGQEVNVPAPTPTPTLSPTPSGQETATPTPTYVAPLVVFPPDGSTAQAGVFSLQWVSAGLLMPDEVYIVYIKDVTSGQNVNAFVTRSTTFELPVSLIPRDGQTHEIQWWVTVGKQNASGAYADVSGQPKPNTFFWQSVSS